MIDNSPKQKSGNVVEDILVVGSNGYIGSEFLRLSRHKRRCIGIDNSLRPQSDRVNKKQEHVDYRDLSKEQLHQFKVVIWLAGHASVPQSVEDPIGCLSNNFTGLLELVERFDGEVIYASSGSVYSGGPHGFSTEDQPLYPPSNIYDFSKMAFDQYQTMKERQVFGLRFGTVVGHSPRIRQELLLNKMVFDAAKHDCVQLANPKVRRPVLFIMDLVNAIDTLLVSKKSNRIYNLASVNFTMEEYAQLVSNYFNCPINLNPSTTTYDFAIANSRFSEEFDFNFTTDVRAIIENIYKAIKA